MNLEELVKDIQQRLAALGQSTSPESLRTLVQECLGDLLKDPNSEFVRKMRFGGGSPQLVGSKYSRWGLSVADIEFLYDLQESLRGLKRVNGYGVYEGPSEELQNTFRAVSQAHYLPEDEIKRIDQRAIDDLFPRMPLAAFHGRDRDLAARGAWQETEAYQRAMRAMDTAESGYGSQLIGAQYVGDLWEGARKDSRIFALLSTFEMTAPTAYLPVEADIPEMLFVSESTASNSSNYTTSKTGSNRVQVNAKKFIIHQMWSGELEEDSIVPFIPFLRMQAMKSVAHYSDSLVLNGDTTNAGTGNINLDDADPADTKHYLAFDGIRHAALVDNTGNASDASGALTYAKLTALRSLCLDRTYLHDWGHPTDPKDFVYIANPEGADEIANLDEVITVDKYGTNATVLTGEVGNIGRNPLISSIAMSRTEADGKVSTTGGNNTLEQVAAFNRRGYVAGWRRRVRVETERLPATDQTRIVYSMRLGLGRFSPTGAASGIEHSAVLYNI